MRHLGLDLVFLVPGETGGRETHVRGLLPALRRAAPDLRITTFLNRETAAAGPGFWSEHADRAVVLSGASGRARGRWAAGELALVGAAAHRAGVDLLHSPANFGPMSGSFARVLTVHDVGFATHPAVVPAPLRALTRALVVPAARRADRVITVSHAAAADVARHLGVAADVIPNGIEPPRPGDPSRVPGERPFALAVGGDLTHKDLDTLEAAAALAGVPLVLAGRGTERRAAGLGAVSAETLEDLYAAAAVVATATRYEGFGLPVLEAQARGIPVVCSDLPVLREVAGDGALFVAPGDVEGFATALRRAVEDPPAVDRAHALGFSWDAAARATLETYDRAARRERRGSRRARP